MKKELVIYKDPKSPISEIFRTLRTNIQFMNTAKNSKTILVTSTFPGEGKSWVSSNLAATFAQTGKKIILIDSDMRKGRQYSILGVSPTPGLSNYLSGVNIDKNEKKQKSIKSYIQKTEIDNLDVMVSGNIPPNPSELLTSTQMIELLEKVKKMYDIVIIDGTPCQLVADSLILARIVDSTIVVTAYKSTKKKDLQRVISGINNVGGKIFGVVLNKIPVPAKKYEQSYYYGSTSDKKSKELTELTVKETEKKAKSIEKITATKNEKEKKEESKKTNSKKEVTKKDAVEAKKDIKSSKGKKQPIEKSNSIKEEKKTDDIKTKKLNSGTKRTTKKQEKTAEVSEETSEEFTVVEKVETIAKQEPKKTTKKNKKGKEVEEKKNIVIPLFDEIMTVPEVKDESLENNKKSKSKRKVMA